MLDVSKMADAVLDAVDKPLRSFPRTIKVLEQRIAELEAKSPLQYEGTWREGKMYNRGAFATHQGGLWHCEDTNIDVRPGSGSPAWVLAVKRGRGDR